MAQGWWDVEGRIATLRRLVDEGLTAGVIRDRMGATSRSAVIGKAHRLGISFKTRDNDTAMVTRIHARRHPPLARIGPRPSPTPRPPVVAPVGEGQKRREIEAIKTLAPAPIDDTGRVAGVIDLSSRMCKWPIGHPNDPGFAFCARSVDRRDDEDTCPYCADHRRLAYQPSKPKPDNGGRELVRALRRFV